MISHLTGTIRHLTTEKVVIEVGGVGYLASISPRTSSKIAVGSDLTISTSLVVREDSMTLFAFLDSQERDLFDTLQTVSGIGPKVALAITGALTPEALAQAIAIEDLATIEKVPGIGKKGAQRLVLELKGKLVSADTSAVPVSHHALRDQVLDALIGLGFSSKESDKAINSTFSHLAENSINPETLGIAEILKLALQSGKR